MRVLTLQSSMIPCVAYRPNHEDDGDPGEGEMFVQFSNGKWAKYSDVARETFLAVILDPESQGKAFNTYIKASATPYAFEYINAEDYDLHV